MKFNRAILATLGLFAALTIVPSAIAEPVTIAGSGTWDAGTPTTAYSEAGATWQFSFELPDPIASNPTTQVTDFSYSLNGNVVTTTLPGGVLFYSVADGGGFDLFPTIDGSSDVGIISILFPEDVGSDLSITLGNFAASIELNDGMVAPDGLLPGSGSGSVSITPEPPSILLLGTALILGAALISHRRSLLPITQSK